MCNPRERQRETRALKLKRSKTLSMKSTLITTTVAAAILSTTQLVGHEYESARPDSHAPIQVMSDHTHQKGEWMVSLRAMRMDMDGMRSGEDNQSSQDVFAANYTVTPTRMTMDMTMLGVMYAPSDSVTFMAMIPQIETKMDHEIFGMAAPLIALNDGSTTFQTRSSGLGDLKLAALTPIRKTENSRAHVTLGFSLPTGSIGEKGIIPGPGGRIARQMPAPMQLGSGTVDFTPGITISTQMETWSYGAQANGRIRLGKNHHNYRLGHTLQATSWVATKVSSNVSLSGRLAYQYTEGLSGTQSDLSFTPPFAQTRRTVTTAFSENYGGQRVDAAIGLNYYVNSGDLSGNRIALEYSIPIHEDLKGYQLSVDSVATLGWQFAW